MKFFNDVFLVLPLQLLVARLVSALNAGPYVCKAPDGAFKGNSEPGFHMCDVGKVSSDNLILDYTCPGAGQLIYHAGFNTIYVDIQNQSDIPLQSNIYAFCYDTNTRAAQSHASLRFVVPPHQRLEGFYPGTNYGCQTAIHSTLRLYTFSMTVEEIQKCEANLVKPVSA